MKKISITYDMDDVLNNLNESVYANLGLLDKLARLKRFNNEKNTDILSDEEIGKLYKAYRNPECFKNLSPVLGTDRIMDIEAKYPDKVEVSIYTHAMNESIDEIKIGFVEEYIPKMPLNRVHITHGEVKEALKGVDIIVEDNLENLLRYEYDTIKILIDKPYNKFESYPELRQQLANAGNLMRVTNLHEAITLIETLVDGGLFDDRTV